MAMPIPSANGTLPGDDDLTQTIFGKKESEVAEFTKQVFDLTIVEDIEQRIVSCALHLYYIGIGQMISTKERLRTTCLVKEREHQSFRL